MTHTVPGPRRRSALLARLAPAADTSQLAIVSELRRAILSGDVAPGTVIPVAEVAAHFGVSHIPVREALKELTAEQLVDHQRNHGYAVATLTMAELAELYVVRGVLEAAALAASIPLAGPEDDAAAADALDALESAHQQGDFRAYHRESRRFHFALVAPSRMHRLISMLESAWNLTEAYQPMAHITADTRDGLHAEHHQMLAAFRSRDGTRLASLAAVHQHDLEASIGSLPPDRLRFADQPRRMA